mmetsp:Transcript_16910/g.48589  ORF Transcript_16910/g.48589 Transcript_16910/m.48589 type:complete len:217 (+) Transcript_16910:165-815(+)
MTGLPYCICVVVACCDECRPEIAHRYIHPHRFSPRSDSFVRELHLKVNFPIVIASLFVLFSRIIYSTRETIVIIGNLHRHIALCFLLRRRTLLFLGAIPGNVEASNTWLVGQNRSDDLFNIEGRRRSNLGVIRIGILIVNIVANANKLTLLVRAGHQNHRYSQNVGVGYAGWVRCIGLEDELVYSNRYWPHQNFIKNLIRCHVLGTANVHDLPFQV